MSIDPSTESLVAIRHAAKYIPGRPHLATIWRWTRRRRNPLAVLRVGGRVFTSTEAIERFIRADNAEGERPVQPDAGRRRRLDDARRELQEAGFSIKPSDR